MILICTWLLWQQKVVREVFYIKYLAPNVNIILFVYSHVLSKHLTLSVLSIVHICSFFFVIFLKIFTFLFFYFYVNLYKSFCICILRLKVVLVICLVICVCLRSWWYPFTFIVLISDYILVYNHLCFWFPIYVYKGFCCSHIYYW